jgi:hypothetical protein
VEAGEKFSMVELAYSDLRAFELILICVELVYVMCAELVSVVDGIDHGVRLYTCTEEVKRVVAPPKQV